MKNSIESLDIWHIFVTVALSGSMNRAAAELGIDVASVSRKIARLEESLGYPLFDRTGTTAILTKEGRRCLSEVLPHISQLMQTVQNFERDEDEVAGPVRVFCAIGLIERMAVWLADFQERYPKAEVQILTMARFSDIRRQPFDLAFWPGPGPREGLEVTDLATTPTYVCASPAYLEQYGEIHEVRDLRNHRVMTNSALAYPPVLYGPDGAVAFPVNRKPAFRIDTMVGLRLAVMQGAGVAVGLPCFMVAPDFKTGRLVRILEPLQSYALHIRLFSKPNPSRKIRVLRDWIKARTREEFGHCPAWGPDLLTIEERAEASYW